MEVYRRHWHPHNVPFVGKVVKSHSTIDFFNKEVIIYMDTTAMGYGDLASLEAISIAHGFTYTTDALPSRGVGSSPKRCR
jgi:hypothetical protein